MKIRSRIILWISIVYIVSFACYLPLFLKELGVVIPTAFLYLRYGFVFIPASVSVLFLAHEHHLKEYFIANFKGITLNEAAISVVTAFSGIIITVFYSVVANTNLLVSAYSSIFAFATSCVYLYVTALIEEMAWRGFLFSQLFFKVQKVESALVVGIVWAIWHIPMWTIRNSLGMAEIIPLFFWTILISIVLGMFYQMFKNLFFVSLLHMLFNTCFLIPTKYNCVILILFIPVCWILTRHKKDNMNL